MEMEIADARSLERATANAAVTRLYAYWVERRGAKTFPSRDDIDPLDFRFVLGRVSLVDVLDAPRRYRYRLVGTAVTDNLGYEMTGKFLDQLPESQMRAYLEQLYGKAVTQRAPVYERDQVNLDGRLWRSETIVLPLSSDGQAINLLMIYRETDRPRPAEGAKS
jgi:hypothetical protein